MLVPNSGDTFKLIQFITTVVKTDVLNSSDLAGKRQLGWRERMVPFPIKNELIKK